MEIKKIEKSDFVMFPCTSFLARCVIFPPYYLFI